jgi:integrase
MCPSGEPGTGRPLNRHNVRRMIREGAKAVGIGHVTPQVLRRSIATAFAEAGVPGHVAASITGHSPAVYHAHYVKLHLDQQEREGALGRLLNFGYGLNRCSIGSGLRCATHSHPSSGS